MDIKEWLNGNDLSLTIWEKKYQNSNETFEEWLDRVSGHNKHIRDLILQKKFLFGGRTLSNRGTNKGSLSNCYSRGFVKDSLTDIMQAATDIAATFKAQGGQGISLSKIRPKGTLINGNYPSDGIIPFMEIFNTITSSISQGGSRKGAIMMSIDVWHKEAPDFITIKTDLNKINKANLSVEIDDNFMRYVDLYYKTGEEKTVTINRNYEGNLIEYEVCPIKLFKLICKTAKKTAEPGVLFTNRLRNYNLMEFVDEYQIETTNPCGEQPLARHSACNLSSINLSEYVINPFKDDAYFDYDALSNDIPYIVEAMDDIVTENTKLHPLKEQREMSERFRNIGIGIMGLADMFVKLKVRYGSKESFDIASKLMKFLFRQAVYASVQLGIKRGNFPGYSNKVWDSEIIKHAFTNDEIEELKNTDRLRNCSLISIAPTGSIGTFLNVSTGCEAFFALSYTRRTVSLNGGDDKYFKVDVDALRQCKEILGIDYTPDYFNTAHELDYHERIKMQSVLQEFVDTAISSTLNCPKTITDDDVEQLYLEAWKEGLKGVTIYVDGSRDPILSTETDKKEDNKHEHCYNCIVPRSRKQIGTTFGSTFCKKCACGTLYITCNRDQKGNFVELFTHTSKGGICQANLNALTRSISLSLRSGVLVDEIVDQLKGIHCPACSMAKAKGNYIDGLSCPDITAKTIIEFLQLSKNDKPIKIEKKEAIVKDASDKNKCPECGEPLIYEGGCVQCTNCGYSKCG